MRAAFPSWPWAAALPLMLAACGGSDTDKSPNLGGDSLELAAQERGLLGDDMPPPAGIFERRSGDGRDRLCVVGADDGAVGGNSGDWRFAAELMTQGQGRCLTSGQLILADAKDSENGQARQSWKLRFRGKTGCEVDAMTEGDVLILPDHLPAACSNICAGRVNLQGAELERTSWAEPEARALRLRGADGSIWTDCGHKIAK